MSATADFQHVYMPAEAPGRPTLLLLHGTGADEHDLLGLGRALAPEAALLSPRGRVSEHGANRWFRRLQEGVFDVEDVIARSRELADFVQDAATEYGLDPSRVVGAGFSNGANIAAATLLLHPGVLAGAALFAAAAPLQDREPERVDLSGTPVFVGAGRADRVIPVEQARLLTRQLRERGAEVQTHEHPGGHALPAPMLAQARDWLSDCGLAGAADEGARGAGAWADAGGPTDSRGQGR